jgi:hypothetical protein
MITDTGVRVVMAGRAGTSVSRNSSFMLWSRYRAIGVTVTSAKG